jgi:hypothetical protein
MTERGGSYEEKYLAEDEISAELLADTLSDVPDDADIDSENDSDSYIIGNRQNKIVHPLPSYSDSEQSANESDDQTLDSAVSTWVKTDKTPNLGPFTRNQGVEQITSDPTKVSPVKGMLILNFRRVLIVVSFLLGKSPASVYYCMPTFQKSLSVPSPKAMVEH